MRRTVPVVVFALLAPAAAGQESKLPPVDRKPALRLDPGGPAAHVQALTFAADGKTLYAAGFDKTIRVYRNLNGAWNPDTPLRVPVGPGNAGAVNALAVSADGRWLAAAGRSPMRDEAGFTVGGVVIDADRRSAAMTRDLGVIYLFDLANPAASRVLRGHRAEVRGLTFATSGSALVSAAVEPGDDKTPTGVVRVWDAATGDELASRSGFPTTLTRVGLAGWPTGPGKKSLAVAVAWPGADPKAGGSLRLWDVATDKLTEQSDGAFNLPLAVLTGADGKPGRILSGGFVNFGGAGQQGQIAVRDLAGGNPRLIGLPPANGVHFLPLAAARAGNSAALLIDQSRTQNGERVTNLMLLDPDTGAGTATATLTGVIAESLPLIAAPPVGDVIAVAGFRDNRVELYTTADLPRGAKPVVLPGGPAGYTGVRFLDAGTALGLAAADGSTLVFDFAKRSVGPPAVGRVADSFPTVVAFERLLRDEKNRHAVRVTSNRVSATCRLNPGAEPTAWAYRPGKPALVAVAGEEKDQGKTTVTLFDAATGRPLRQLTGHLRPVRAMAFSAAKPLLASAGDDGTVCVWTLKDLDREPGAVEGLAVVERGGAVVVEAAFGQLLAAGDVIEAVGGGDKPQPVKTVADFVWRAAAVPPGGVFPVRVRGKNQAVNLPVTRGVDERKPLFTLWIGAGGAEWVGWSPAGPYDASGPAAEAKIGWLTNTGDPAAPTTFAAAREYRDTYFRKDLLKLLAANGELTAALDAWLDAYGPPQPQIAARVPEAVGGVVRFGMATLRVELSNVSPDYPMADAVLRYRLRRPGAAAPAWAVEPVNGRRTLTLGLPAITGPRGPLAVDVELLRRPTGSPVRSETVEFAAAPPAPALVATVGGVEVDAKTQADKRKVTVTKLPVRLAVKATGQPNEAVVVTVANGTTERPLAAAADGTFPAVELPLTPGGNAVRVRAVAAAATAATRAAETTELVIAVQYDPPAPEPTPEIEPITLAPPGERFRLGDTDVIAVTQPKVVASARVTASHPLTAVGVAVGGKPAALDAAGAKAFTARRELTLEPGVPVRVVVSAATANSPTGERPALVAYVPALPRPNFNPLAAADVFAPDLTVSGVYVPPADGAPASIRVTVASLKTGETRSFDATAAAGTFTAAVALFPGANTLSLAARNQWRDQTTDAVTVTYRRPPRIIDPPAQLDAGETGVVDLVLTVETAEGLDPQDLLVDGRPVPMAAPERVAAKDGLVRWKVAAAAAPVADSDKKLRVVVRNADGPSEAVAVAVKRAAPVIAKPAINLTGDVPVNAPLEGAAVVIPFQVRSPARILRVRVEHAPGGVTDYEPLAGYAMGAPVKSGDAYTLEERVTVPLTVGANRIRIVAVNEGGETVFPPFTVSRTEPPVAVEIEALEELNPVGAPVRAHGPVRGGPFPRFPEMPTGYVRVRGYVRWADPAAVVTDPGLTAAVTVNGADHPPVQLEPAAGGRRAFKAPLFLNGRENVVRLAVRAGGQGRALPQTATGARVFRVGCATPLTRKRLHVVVIGVGAEPAEKAGRELSRQAVLAFGGTADPGFAPGEFTAPGFEQAILYRPWTGVVTSGNITDALTDVTERVRKMAESSSPNDWADDVVLIYFQGKDWVDENKRLWLHTSQSLKYKRAEWKKYGVAADDLPASAGVRLLLLSVVAPPDPAGAANDPGVPLLRYAWSDPADPPALLPLFREALAGRVQLKDVARDAGERFLKARGAAGAPEVELPDEVGDRPIGRGRN